MVRRIIGQEEMFGTERRDPTDLDDLASLIDWDVADALMGDISSSTKGEQGWPPLCLFKALLLGRWYNLSDVKLAEALDDSASFRRFSGFLHSEATPERTAFIRFRKALCANDLGDELFRCISDQLLARHVEVKLGTMIDATILASASKDDQDARWIKHKGRKAVHGYKAHTAADVSTDLVEEINVTPANINDGNAGCDVVPDKPGQVYADSAYRGPCFRKAVEERGGVARVVAVSVWARSDEEAKARLAAHNGPIH
ncbi:MAG: transposase, partial [Cohaesibacter sp.]|nr:transposase [Cohaesibacter sp.]